MHNPKSKILGYQIYMYDMAECSTKYRTEGYTDKLEIVCANHQRQCI
jgi:hypothetical protein